MKTPITWPKLKTHFTYSWWKYLLGVVFAAAALAMFFTVTAARPREDQQVDLYVYGTLPEEPLDRWLEQLRASEFPDQARFDCFVIAPDNTSGIQIFTTRVGLGEGDLLLLPRTTFEEMAWEGFLLPLETDWMEAELKAQGINPESGYWRGRNAPEDERRLYGIPVSEMKALNAWITAVTLAKAQQGLTDGAAEPYYLCVRVSNGNEATVWQVLRRMMQEWSAAGDPITLTMLQDAR